MCGTGDRGAGETPSTTTTSAATRLHNVNSSNNSAVSSRMPASSSDDPVSNALHMSLLANKCSTLKCNSSSVSGENGVVTTLDNKLVASTKRVLLAEIAFEKCNSYSSTVLDSLKQRYIVLNTTTTNDSSKVVRCGGVSDETKKTKVSVTSSADDGLPKPKIVLYPADNVQLGWQGSAPVGAGMVNLRNTCYLNSTLQALFHVPAFVNWLMNDKSHVSKCSLLNGLTHSECLICAMKSVLIAHRSTNNAIKPLQIYSKLKLICKHFVHGQQEDAHEFLRYLIESMERSYLNVVGGLKLDSYSKETTPLNQIFGGYLRTEVTCLVCGHVSTTYQHFQDLPLDIRQVSSVEAALDTYFSREQLGAAVGGSNEEEAAPYKCDKCHRRVNATKKFSLQRAPNVLCLQLKRFGITGGKMSKHISLQMSLDITRHMHASTHSGGGSQRTQRYRYRLVSMISHIGPSSGCGHYTAMAAASSGQFYLFDDNLVRQMTVSNVLYNSNAYVIIYELEPTSSSFSASSSSSSSFSSSSSALSTLHQRSSSNCSRAPASPSSSSSGSSASGAKIVQNGSGGSGGDVTPSPSPTQSGGGKVLPLYIKPPCTTTTTTTPNSNHCATATTSVVAVAPKHERASSSSSSSTSTTTSASFATSFSSSCHSTPSSSSSSLSVQQQQQRHHAITTTTTSSNSPLKQQQVSTAIKKLPCNGGVASLPPSPSSSTSPTKKRLVPYTTTESDSDSDESGGEQVVSSTSSSSSPFPRPPRSSTTELSKKLEIDCGSSTATTTPHPSSATNVWHVTEVTTSSQPQQQQHSSSSTASVSSSCSNNSSVGNWSVTDSSKKQPTRSTPGDGGNSRVGDRTNGGVPIGQLTEQHVLNSSSISSNKWNHSNGGCADRKGAGGGKMWDGSRADTETVGGLLKMSHRGYGGNANVSTWEGGRSELDQELDKDKINEQRKQKRNYYSSGNSGYDDELDRGKVKKMKYNSSSSSNIGNGGNCNQRYNPFQEHQNRKNNSWYNNNNKRPPFYHNNSLDRYRNGNRSNSNSYHRNSFNRWRH